MKHVLRYIILVTCVTTLCSCAKIKQVFPDKQTEYQNSTSLPALEVPPDLTVTEGNYKANIPGETQSISLSEFKQNREKHLKRSNTVLGAGETEDEHWLALRGAVIDIWPKLQEFWQEKEYQVALDYPGLGVLETEWQETETTRVKYRILAEADETEGTILFLASEQQTLSEGEWVEADINRALEKEILRELNRHFYAVAPKTETNDEATAAPALPDESQEGMDLPQAEIVAIDEGKSYLIIPEAFDRAWENMKTLILESGYSIENEDQEKGIYDLHYKDDSKKGVLSRIKFWGNDDSTLYKLSLIGVGDKTEVIVMDENGEWAIEEVASQILSTLKNTYNKS